MTALGRVRVRRENSHDPIHGSVFRADLALGLDGFLTRQATRLVTLAGVEHSFARGQRMLAEFCGWQVDDEVIRRTTHAQAKRATGTRGERGEGEAFAAGAGGAEVLVDAGKAKMAALGACMRKLLMIAYGVLKSRTAFDPKRGSKIAP